MREENVYKYLLVEQIGSVCNLTINNPKKLNALNSEILNELDRFIDYIVEEERINVLVISGAGKAFIAGADILEMAEMDVSHAKSFSIKGSTVFRKIEKLPKIVIAKINGFALGGGLELAMACDLRLTIPEAKLGQPELGIGIMPGFSATQRLPRIVGVSKAKEMLLLSKLISGEEAYRIGLVNFLVKSDELDSYTIDLAEKLSKKSSEAMAYIKEAVNIGIETDIDSAIMLECNLFSMCFGTLNQKEGMKAFLEKRTPEFNK